MKKARVIICLVFIYFLLYFLQVNFFSWFTIAGVKPNLFLLFTLFIGLYMDGKMGAILGMFFGLYSDFLFSQVIGITAILFSIVGIFGEVFDRKFSIDSKLNISIICGLTTIGYEIVNYLYTIFKTGSGVNIIAFFKILLLETIYNILITIIFYPLINKFGKYAEQIFKSRKMLPRYFS